jgi:hypothetical protein
MPWRLDREPADRFTFFHDAVLNGGVVQAARATPFHKPFRSCRIAPARQFS